VVVAIVFAPGLGLRLFRDLRLVFCVVKTGQRRNDPCEPLAHDRTPGPTSIIRWTPSVIVRMRVRDWDDILRDVIESDADPDGWRAVGGDRQGGIGEDLYVAHPGVGAYQLKTYARNPYEVDGVGAQVARRIDDELDPLFPDEDGATGLFGVQKGTPDEETATEQAKDLETVVETHADAPTTPQALFEDIMDALDSPAYGPMEFDQHDRPAAMDELTDTFEEAQQLLEAEFEDVVDENVERGFQ
jgi:hypothetical protein